ncbi:RimJ/RimL family protein N-acetyltransferase [Haloactinopolyspora alba]|uniref:Lysine N-acyltransferase MbtK n=1 Tax=Haloactinopolyspora alba TaxID=648780 RepID=A0A2P8EFH4_9ACTN|nr:GNAT family N-acetyltransferase [Haloactinopolyspora alba]PSL08203.1 RimJ/RimL family protein N-acetyltransferase [Haloactinopolyspora alba]
MTPPRTVPAPAPELPRRGWSVTLPGATTALTFRPARADADAELIHDWMHRPHVVPWWQLDRALDGIRAYLDGLEHLWPWVVSAGDVAFGYVETYRVADDPLAAAYPALPGDVGWHVLVGPQEQLGTGTPQLLARVTLAALLGHGDRAVCEPDVRNARMLAFCRGLGLRHDGEIDLPDKRAALLTCTRAEFDARWPGDRAAVEGAS